MITLSIYEIPSIRFNIRRSLIRGTNDLLNKELLKLKDGHFRSDEDICLTDKSVMEKEYEGYVFDKIKRTDGLYQYVVYLPDLKLVSRLKERDELANYERCKFTLYVFNDQDRLKKKI